MAKRGLETSWPMLRPGVVGRRGETSEDNFGAVKNLSGKPQSLPVGNCGALHDTLTFRDILSAGARKKLRVEWDYSTNAAWTLMALRCGCVLSNPLEQALQAVEKSIDSAEESGYTGRDADAPGRQKPPFLPIIATRRTPHARRRLPWSTRHSPDPRRCA